MKGFWRKRFCHIRDLRRLPGKQCLREHGDRFSLSLLFGQRSLLLPTTVVSSRKRHPSSISDFRQKKHPEKRKENSITVRAWLLPLRNPQHTSPLSGCRGLLYVIFFPWKGSGERERKEILWPLFPGKIKMILDVWLVGPPIPACSCSRQRLRSHLRETERRRNGPETLSPL